MKKLYITAFAVIMLLCTATAMAQNEPKAGHDFPSEKMVKELNLTDQQVADLKKGEADLISQMKQMREDMKANKKEMKEMREGIDKMKQARLEMMKKVLNSDQYVKFLEDEYMKPERRMMMRPMNMNGGMNGNMNGGWNGPNQN